MYPPIMYFRKADKLCILISRAPSSYTSRRQPVHTYRGKTLIIGAATHVSRRQWN